MPACPGCCAGKVPSAAGDARPQQQPGPGQRCYAMCDSTAQLSTAQQSTACLKEWEVVNLARPHDCNGWQGRAWACENRIGCRDAEMQRCLSVSRPLSPAGLPGCSSRPVSSTTTPCNQLCSAARTRASASGDHRHADHSADNGVGGGHRQLGGRGAKACMCGSGPECHAQCVASHGGA